MQIVGPQSIVRTIKLNGRRCARKFATEAGLYELLDQITLLQMLPAEMAQHYPELLDFNVVNHPFYYTMPFYGISSLRDLVLKSEESADVISEKINRIIHFLIDVQHQWKIQQCPTSYIEDIYLTRARQRLLGMRGKDPTLTQIIECNQIVVNDEVFPNPIVYLERLSLNTSLIEMLTPKTVCSTHGQMGFTHILVDGKAKDRFILLDPKGIKYLLDPSYDFGKLRQCSNSHFDWVLDRLYAMPRYHMRADKLIVDGFAFALPERLAVCSQVNVTIEKTLEQNLGTGQNADISYRRSVLAEAIHLCGSTAFCYEFGGIDMAIACFLLAAKSIANFEQICQ